MSQSSLVMYEAELKAIQQAIGRLAVEARARAVFVVNKDGQLIASAGNTADIDSTSLAALIAGNAAATGSLARILGEQREFSVTYNEGARENLYGIIAGGRVILVVIFDSQTSSLGLVRLRVKKTKEELEVIIERVVAKGAANATLPSPLAEITDDDIENLFR